MNTEMNQTYMVCVRYKQYGYDDNIKETKYFKSKEQAIKYADTFAKEQKCEWTNPSYYGVPIKGAAYEVLNARGTKSKLTVERYNPPTILDMNEESLIKMARQESKKVKMITDDHVEYENEIKYKRYDSEDECEMCYGTDCKDGCVNYDYS